MNNGALYGNLSSLTAGTNNGFEQSGYQALTPTKTKCTANKMASGFYNFPNTGGVTLQCGSTPAHMSSTNFFNLPANLNGVTTTTILNDQGHFMNIRA